MKLYGSLNNRFDENHYFNGTYNNIKVGTQCTEYLYTDRHAYEVVEVIDQNHISIRRLKAIRTDKLGMSDCQNYRYESDPRATAEPIEFHRGSWKRVSFYDLNGLQHSVDYLIEHGRTPEEARKIAEECYMYEFTPLQKERLLKGERIKKYKSKINISFGVADEYYDYSF